MTILEKILSSKSEIDECSKIRRAVIDKCLDKYSSQEHKEREARALSAEDCDFLFRATRTFFPKNIIEIGTWFGTSAFIMSASCGATVYTCDRNNVFSEVYGTVKFYNMGSEKFIKKMKKKGLRFDMCFIDATISKIDAKEILEILDGPIIVHDYEIGEKGFRNVQLIQNCSGNAFNVFSHGIFAILEKK